jgi:cardiolipin synthase
LRRKEDGEEPLPEHLSDSDKELAGLLSRLNILTSSRCDEANLLSGGAAFYSALEQEVKAARTSLYVEFFIWRADACGLWLLELLVEAARRGVKVRVMVDNMGSIGLPRSYFQPLVEAGGKFSWFNTRSLLWNRWTFNLRNHRKLQVIDGQIAFVGGMNLGREYRGEDPKLGEWSDLQLRVQGAVARKLQSVFEEDWYFATDEDLRDSTRPVSSSNVTGQLVQIIEDGPDSDRFPTMMSVVSLLNAARDRIWFTAGYFFPQEPLLSALTLCAARGVDVRILVPVKTEHPYIVKGARSYYEELLSSRVRIFEFACGTHHAKSILMDDRWLSVGSANLDIRSMRLNFELNLILHSPALAVQLEEIFLADFQKSKEVNLHHFRQRSTVERLIENSCRLFGPVL